MGFCRRVSRYVDACPVKQSPNIASQEGYSGLQNVLGIFVAEVRALLTDLA